MQQRLTADELIALQEMWGHSVLMSGLRKIFDETRLSKLDAMKSEALGPARPLEIVKYAAEARAFEEWEQTISRRMTALAPRIREEP